MLLWRSLTIRSCGEIRAWAIINHTAFNIGIRPSPGRQNRRLVVTGPAAGIAAAWQVYYSVRARWSSGVSFHERYPQELTYIGTRSRRSPRPLSTAAAAALQKLAAQDEGAQAVSADPIAPLLLRVYEAGLIDAYVLFSLGDDGIAKDYTAYRATNRARLEDYLDRFVMPQTPPSAPATGN